MKNLFRILVAWVAFATIAAGCTETPRTADGKAVPERVLGVYRLYPGREIPPPHGSGGI